MLSWIMSLFKRKSTRKKLRCISSTWFPYTTQGSLWLGNSHLVTYHRDTGFKGSVDKDEVHCVKWFMDRRRNLHTTYMTAWESLSGDDPILILVDTPVVESMTTNDNLAVF